ncbi:MAG TPA: tetratricopeptide repeat protein [Candidatus Sabulitectum sp.]|nr:tetratricopeptide repeat protein [Candidatus Sabulitectum sp.]HPF31553.1 tetratricopeptide repeat protein [Candidatus Sabulitectum sp.]HPJ27319.1 tetratricopeptide repeat protein [Candidatus Sabulitectum sp.]HPR21124.1 tetratricopeptide repeat protein [Candidatus Sabulitectum sp.]
MNTNTCSRKILAVMFTDVAGFTSHMERNETAAMEMISLIREELLRLLSSNDGTLIKEMGDGTLTVFSDPGSALETAMELQNTLRGRGFSIRIGIHMGGVHLRPGDVMGDTVNVASRLEKMAPPGGICISREFLQAVSEPSRPEVHSMGLRKLRGLGRLMEICTVKRSGEHSLPFLRDGEAPVRKLINLHGEIPSITVIPLKNLGTGEDDYYSNGLSRGIAEHLASAGGVAVAPLEDVMELRRAVCSESSVASRLNTRFFLTGTLLREDRRFSLTVKLNDLQTGNEIWTDDWTDDWFELQTIGRKVADSILKVLGTGGIGHMSPGEGTEEYELYLRASEAYWRRSSFEDVLSARELLEKALQLDPRMMDARILLGTTFTENGDFARGEEEFLRAYETAQEMGDGPAHLRSLIWIGINQWRQSDFLAAKHTFKRTMTMARAMGELQAEARSICNMGLMECNLGEYDSALELLRKTMGVPGISSMGTLKANVLCNIGLTYWNMGDNQVAYEYYLKALELFQELESADGTATLMMNLGIVTRSMGMFRESLDYTRKALELHRRIGDLQGLCRSTIGMGNTRWFTGDSTGALKDYRSALELAVEIGDRMTEGIALTNMADIHLDSGKLDEAEKLYRGALGISSEIGDREGEGENLGYIGAVLRRRGEMPEAAEYLKRSISVFMEMDAPVKAMTARLDLAGVLLEGPEGNTDAAMEQIRTVEETLHPGVNDFILINHSLSRLYGKLSLRLPGDYRNKLLAKSAGYLKAARDSLMRTAGSIDDTDLRESFLSKKVHSAIMRTDGSYSDRTSESPSR